MKHSAGNLLFGLSLLSTFNLQPSTALAQGTAFTYQGRLSDGANPANGIYDLRFAVYDAVTSGAQQGAILTNSATAVTNGLFTVTLDFGPGVFDGSDRWLAIGVRPGASAGDFTSLVPRQPLTSTPYAVRAGSAGSLPTGAITSAMLADGAVTSAKIAPGAINHLGSPDGSPLTALQVNTNGLVGVGTDAPAAGLHITTSQTILNPVPLSVLVDESGGYTSLDGATGVAVEGNLVAVAAQYDHAVTLVDIANPALPVLRSQIRYGGGVFTNLTGANTVAMKPNLLAVGAASDRAVTLINVANPAAPVKLAEIRDGVGGFNDLDGVRSVAIQGNLMAVAAFNDNAVTLVNIANPAAPVKHVELKDGFFGFTNLAGARGVALSGNLMAIAAFSDHAVTLVDVTDPANPIKLAELRDEVGGYTGLYGAVSVALSGNLLAIAGYYDNTLTLVDVSNPAAPVKLGEWRDGVNADHLAGAGQVAFSGTGRLAVGAEVDQAITVFDVANPAAARLAAVVRRGVGGFNHLEWVWGVVFTPGGHLVAVARVSDAITMLELTAAPAGMSSAGWVGIGTALPAAPLHVVGNVVVEGAQRIELSAKFTQLGYLTTASGTYSTAMGLNTIASGDYSTAMGANTTASGDFSTAMGLNTTASGDYSTAMGANTTASGYYSTVMGLNTTASGYCSTAMGYRAHALHRGSFVWADEKEVDFDSTTNNQFSIRASNGVRLANDTSLNFGNQTRQMLNLWNTDFGVGVQLASLYFRSGTRFTWFRGGTHRDAELDAGGGDVLMTLTTGGLTVNGTFVSSSDRNAKENFQSIEPRTVLDKVCALPIAEWNFKADPGTRHLGPVAQDFRAAFGLGPDDKHIATVDADGVALAAIQGLNEKVECGRQKAENRIATLEAENAELNMRLARLEKLISAVAAATLPR
jgi:hypothetical protein